MPYEFYKVLHLVSIFLFLTSTSVLLLGKLRSRALMITSGLSGLLILVAGMGLIARLRVGFPPWVVGKLVIWFVLLGLGHMVAKRFPNRAAQAYWTIILLAGMAATLAVYKP